MYAVVKIGGSLLKSIDSYIHNALKIMEVFIEKNVYPLIIVSAPKGLTNILYDAVNYDPSKMRQVEDRVYDLISEIDNETFKRKIESIFLKAPLIEYDNDIVVHVSSWSNFGTIIKKKVKTLGKPKVLGVRQSASYMALIGGCSSSSLIVKKVLDVLLEEGISIHEIQAYSEKPLSILKVSHEELVSASRIILGK